jgi:hypothetical protein
MKYNGEINKFFMFWTPFMELQGNKNFGVDPKILLTTKQMYSIRNYSSEG